MISFTSLIALRASFFSARSASASANCPRNTASMWLMSSIMLLVDDRHNCILWNERVCWWYLTAAPSRAAPYSTGHMCGPPDAGAARPPLARGAKDVMARLQHILDPPDPGLISIRCGVSAVWRGTTSTGNVRRRMVPTCAARSKLAESSMAGAAGSRQPHYHTHHSTYHTWTVPRPAPSRRPASSCSRSKSRSG